MEEDCIEIKISEDAFYLTIKSLDKILNKDQLNGLIEKLEEIADMMEYNNWN